MALTAEQVGQYRRDGYVWPVPARDFDPEAVAFHAKAAKAMRDVLYAGAEKKLQRL